MDADDQDYGNNKATVRVISIESEPKNIHLFLFLPSQMVGPCRPFIVVN